MKKLNQFAVSALLLMIAAPILRAQPSTEDLKQLDLQELMNIEVTSVSRRPERLSDAAASIFVITGEEIRRSGATNLPEALRLAPALHVVQVDAGGYTLTSRGFMNAAANKLLVLIDGRPAYTPLFSGIFWDVQDVLLEDVDRIEVISGPGGTLWGVNAVNGVINIITRSAANTHGPLVAAGGGNRETVSALRYGDKAGASAHYRLYGKYVDGDHTETASGTVKDDAFHRAQAGFRGDWERGPDQFMMVGTAYKGAEGQPLPGAIQISGVDLDLGVISFSGLNLTGRWKRRLRNGASLTIQGYFDRTQRTNPPTFAEKLDIADLQFLHSWRPGGKHTVSWGAEYRYGMDRLTNSAYIAFLPANVNQTWASVFAQDEIALGKNVRLTIGARGEHNDYTGMEFLPNARMAWKVAPEHLLWAAASRAVRAPSRLDRDAFVPGAPPFLLTGGPEVVSEVANVYEIGYRGRLSAATNFSVTAFHSLYDHLRTQEIAPSRTSLFFANGMEGTITGVEMWASRQATPIWRLSGGFTAQTEEFRLKPGSNDTAAVAQTGRDPEQSWQLRSSLDLPWRGEFDLTARHVAALSAPTVPSYTAVDVRYGWKLRPDIELSLTGSNLFDKGHGEFTDIATRTEIGRSVFIKAVYRPGEAL